MDRNNLKLLLEQVRTGNVEVESAMERLKHMPFEDLGFAKVDHHRALRHGMPKWCSGRARLRPDRRNCGEASRARAERVDHRAEPAAGKPCTRAFPDAEHFPLSQAIRVWRDRTVHGKGKIAVVCAGTSDLFVAEEAQVTAEVMGNTVETIHDIGVAGIHRLMNNRERLNEARVVVVCAGMEGALPSAVGGLVRAP
jgi:NCAIR mutase (PurE)-related protein